MSHTRFVSLACSFLLLTLNWATWDAPVSHGEGASTEISPPPQATDSKSVDYGRDIRPILSENCYTCHGPNAEDREAELRLDLRESVFGEAASGELAIVPSKLEESELLRRIASGDEDEIMPPTDSGKTLEPEQVALFRRWIAEGADWQEHWAFVPPHRKDLPSVSDANWPQGAIDSFVLAKLDQEKLKPSPATDKETLLRRVTFDLTGLPPTLAEMDAYLADDSPHAYEQVVDRLLQSPHYGEHMARFWLDAARYGDTHGLHLDNYREMWPYRDWVVRAFNDNMPYDQFTIEQLAGDLLPDATLDQQIATGFCRCHVTTNEGGSIEEEFFVRNVVDRVVTTGTVFLGLTLECTRCHDHKYDPLTMHDFYSMFAFFNSLDGPAMDGNVKDTRPIVHVPSKDQAEQLDKLQSKLANLTTQTSKRRKEAEPEFQQWHQLRRLLTSIEGMPNFQPPADGLLGHFSLELQEDKKGKRVTNVVNPSAGGKIHGEVKVVSGRQGNGLEFAENGFIDLGNVFGFEQDQKFSFSAWIQTPENATGAILSKTTKERRGYALMVENGYLHFYLTSRADGYGITVATTAKNLTQNGWHHVVVSYDASAKAGGIVIYVDGVRQKMVVKMDSITSQGRKYSINSGGAHLQIGRRGEEKNLTGGQVDEVCVYERCLSQADVKCVMLADGVSKIVAQPIEQTTESQWQELRDYYFHRFDLKYAEMINEQVQLYAEETAIQRTVPITLVFRERKKPRDSFLLNRGEYDQRGEQVERATPAMLPPMLSGAPMNRLGLAQWLVEKQHPLTARVAVNRFWAQFFGTGIVKTAENFGSQGEVPSHPELLDWLAVELIESGWDVKALVKRIVMSSTYRQSSRIPQELVERDPGNRLLARGPRFRLDAEMLRDQALAVSGLLVKRLGGAEREAASARWSVVCRGLFGFEYRAISCRHGVRQSASPHDVYLPEAHFAAAANEHLRRAFA